MAATSPMGPVPWIPMTVRKVVCQLREWTRGNTYAPTRVLEERAWQYVSDFDLVSARKGPPRWAGLCFEEDWMYVMLVGSVVSFDGEDLELQLFSSRDRDALEEELEMSPQLDETTFTADEGREVSLPWRPDVDVHDFSQFLEDTPDRIGEDCILGDASLLKRNAVIGCRFGRWGHLVGASNRIVFVQRALFLYQGDEDA
ncbi:hypothetical protein OBBRIDRAFT_804822 [Obba rivulosa]|uniref:Uncharacterized protein n=1 Tax=Obba rivulosa TaxID=1052685 RepID=A0A8E2DN92_9APHY|nr:hypothetical protein OBBRIDRAFT_804822 [Obba rivulosa]